MWAKRTFGVCAVAAIGEMILFAAAGTGESALNAAVLAVFLVGVPGYVAVLAWRRRTHPTRPKVLFGLAVVIAAVGLGLCADRLARPDPQAAWQNPVAVPLAQWVLVLPVWLVLVVREGIEKRGTNAG